MLLPTRNKKLSLIIRANIEVYRKYKPILEKGIKETDLLTTWLKETNATSHKR